MWAGPELQGPRGELEGGSVCVGVQGLARWPGSIGGWKYGGQGGAWGDV